MRLLSPGWLCGGTIRRLFLHALALGSVLALASGCWRSQSLAIRTVGDIQNVAVGVELHRLIYGFAPQNLDSVVAWLNQTELALLPLRAEHFVDGWGHALLYEKLPSGAHQYVLASCGRDGDCAFKQDHGLELGEDSDDLIVRDGRWLAGPSAQWASDYVDLALEIVSCRAIGNSVSCVFQVNTRSEDPDRFELTVIGFGVTRTSEGPFFCKPSRTSGWEESSVISIGRTLDLTCGDGEEKHPTAVCGVATVTAGTALERNYVDNVACVLIKFQSGRATIGIHQPKGALLREMGDYPKARRCDDAQPGKGSRGDFGQSG